MHDLFLKLRELMQQKRVELSLSRDALNLRKFHLFRTKRKTDQEFTRPLEQHEKSMWFLKMKQLLKQYSPDDKCREAMVVNVLLVKED